MKFTKSRLKQIIKEELNEMLPLAIRMGQRRQREADIEMGERVPDEDHPGETCDQAHPEQEHKEWVVTIAEVSSEKQRRWACAQKDKPASSRKKSLSAAEAEEMCKSQVEKK
jgi:hypothetical protein